jgi:PHD/YefM family antitoxin component YafN of YafNO toxin-antitoxin module
MTVTPTEFRNNLFSMLDSVINEKEHIDINRNGTIIHLVPERKKSRLESLTPANFQNCSDEELENIKWENEWKPFI